MSLFGRVGKYARTHKFISAVVVVVVVLGGWWMYANATSTKGQTRYILGTVASGTVVASVSESGQVSASQQLNLTAQVTGEVIALPVKAGDKVKAGALIAEIDPTNAQKAVRDAQANLLSAQIALQKLQEPATTLSVTQAQDALTNAQSSLATDYTNAQNDITSAFLDLPSVVTGLQDVITGTETNKSAQWNVDYYENVINQYDNRAKSFRDDAYNAYIQAQSNFSTAFADFKSADLTDKAQAEKILEEAYSAAQLVSNAIKNANALVQLYEDTLKAQAQTPLSVADTQLTTLANYTSKVNTHLSTLLADQNALTTDKQGITEKQQSLQQLNAGADALDLQSAQLNVTKAQNALEDAQNTLANYYIRAPFDGVVATVSATKYGQTNGTIATLVTTQQYADLSINEVDAAKISVGQKATLTFDAIPDLTLTGTVVEINPVGTVTQGVVSYDVKIGFDAQNTQVKSGMTVNAKIITQTAVDALVVPSSAVKTVNGQSVVQVFDPPLDTSSASPAAGATKGGVSAGVVSKVPPQMVPVVIGISDTTNTQILSGLTLGEQVVVRTSTSGTQTQTATTGGAGGARGNAGFGGGGAIRIGG
jgi:HlyD family secretion protein